MKVVFYLNIVSPHQLPLAREVVRRVGADNFIYIYDEDFHAERVSMGWSDKVDGMRVEKLSNANRDLLEKADLLYTGIRCLDLLQRRASRGLKSYYHSERWFKPLNIGVGERCRCSLPGWMRMLSPSYRRMAKGFVRWINSDPNARYLAIGPWAKKDMLKLGVNSDKIVDWGYFVEPSNFSRVEVEKCRNDFGHGERVEQGEVKVLYVGRLLKLKHVDTIIRAIAHLNSHPSHSKTTNSTIPNSSFVLPNSLPRYTLTIVGDGPEKSHLQKLASTVTLNLQPQPVIFHPSVPISEVRQIMRNHDILVFASDASDGWGAVVNEALSEGTPVIGTYETGASAALLPDAQLFHCGDYKELARKLSALHLSTSTRLNVIPYNYTPKGAAECLLNV